MGAVYEAADLSMPRLVAVKILQAGCFGDDGALRRFEREARILGSLSQPNVVNVHDHGTLSAGGAYLVMERLYGSTWRASLRERETIERGRSRVAQRNCAMRSSPRTPRVSSTATSSPRTSSSRRAIARS